MYLFLFHLNCIMTSTSRFAHAISMPELSKFCKAYVIFSGLSKAMKYAQHTNNRFHMSIHCVIELTVKSRLYIVRTNYILILLSHFHTSFSLREKRRWQSWNRFHLRKTSFKCKSRPKDWTKNNLKNASKDNKQK